MNTKSLALLGAIASAAVVALTGAAEAQGRRYWQPDPGYQDDYRGGGYRPDYGYAGGRRGCLSSNGINASLARNGWYPMQTLAGAPMGRILHMQVAQRGRILTAAVDGCTGRILQMWGPNR